MLSAKKYSQLSLPVSYLKDAKLNNCKTKKSPEISKNKKSSRVSKNFIFLIIIVVSN